MTDCQWYMASIEKLQKALIDITQDQRRHNLHNEGGWDTHLVRLDVCRDIVDGLVREARSWTEVA